MFHIKLRCSWGLEGERKAGTWLLASDQIGEDAVSRLAICEDSKTGESVMDGGLPYRQGAILAGDSWRCATEEDFSGWSKSNLADNVLAPGDFVGLVKLNSLVHFELLRMISDVERAPEVFGAEFVDLVQLAIQPNFACTGAAQIIGIARYGGLLETVTIDYRKAQRIGLHLDSWEDAKIGRRRFARNRISINMGKAARRLLFMTTSVDFLFSAFGLLTSPNEYPVDQIWKATSGQDRRIYSLEIRPGEAYIAPTECLLHDASTKLSSAEDVTAVARIPILPVVQM
jgi:hypothetical protein